MVTQVTHSVDLVFEPKSLTSKKTLAHRQLTSVSGVDFPPCPLPFLTVLNPAPQLPEETTEPPSLSQARGPEMKDTENPLASQED